MVELNGTELTIEQVMAVARHKEQVRISEPAKQKIDRARAYVDEKLAQKAVIYGLTTGFGKFSDTFVPEQETAALQRNLIISHACGMGAPLPREVEQYTEYDLQRLAVKPGITGWWQVTDRNDTDFDGMVRRDLEYIAKRGPITDLKIVLLTVVEVFTGGGAC